MIHKPNTAGWLAVGLLALAPAAGGCDPSDAAPGSSRGRPNVVLICMDTVRADRLGCYGYTVNPTSPHLDALAARSTLFLDASATSGWTKPSVPSFMTGTFPAQHGVYEGSARGIGGKVSDVLPADALTLAEVFEQHGYRTGAVIHNDHLRKGSGLEQGFQYYEDRADDARDIRWRALDWLDSDEAGERPFFLYLHFLDAHYPYPVPDAYAKRFLAGLDASVFRTPGWRGLRDAINHGKRALGGGELLALKGLYDGSIRYIDDQLGLFFEALRLRSALDNTIICVIADHGEEFMEHGRIGHGHGLYENLLRVPWILHVPGDAPRRVSATVSLVDLFPTLLAAAGLEPEGETEGIERFSEPDRSRAILAEHKKPNGYLQSYRKGAVKVLRHYVPPWRERESLALRDFLEPGTRWDARLELLPDGTRRAKRLKPRPEDNHEPSEIKGTIADLTGTTMTLAGFPVRVLAMTEFYGAVKDDDAGIASVHVGSSVKAVGGFLEGVFTAQRIKVYPPGAEARPTLRGPLEAVEGTVGEGRIRLGEAWVAVDDQTDWDIEDFDIAQERMERGQVAEVLALGPEAAAREGFRVTTDVFDLAADPAEQRPIHRPSRRMELVRELNHLGRDLLERRVYGERDRSVLTREQVDRLRAIGYVD